MNDKFNTEIINIELHFEPAPVSAVRSSILPLDTRPKAYTVNDQNMADYDAFVLNICGIVECSGYTIEKEQLHYFDSYVICRSDANNNKQQRYAIYIKITDNVAEQFTTATTVKFRFKNITINNLCFTSYEDALEYLEEKLDSEGENLLTYSSSRINPRMCDKYNINIEIEQRISEDELRNFPGSIPHMRICLDLSENPKQYAYIRLDKPEYLPECQSADISKKKAAIIDVLSSPWHRYLMQSHNTNQVRTATGYEAAVNIWIDTYSDNNMFSDAVFQYDENGFPVMPDYSLL
ncbi:MAG: hypothetical protein LUI14_13525 [Lachnospiraceae bacterium]|nr:hypothetical protein [Lachnospiraceae bacterium]